MKDLDQYRDLEALAALAFAKARWALTALEQDVLPHLDPSERPEADRLHAALAARELFERDLVAEIDTLLDRLAMRIEEGTRTVECVDNDPCNVSPAVWTEKHRDAQARDLGRASMVIFDLLETLRAVHDRVDSERAIAALRAAD